jgi:hypothetical protein
VLHMAHDLPDDAALVVAQQLPARVTQQIVQTLTCGLQRTDYDI